MDYKTVLKPAVYSAVLMVIVSSVFFHLASTFSWGYNEVVYQVNLLFAFITGFLAVYLFIRTKDTYTHNKFIMLVLITDILYVIFDSILSVFQSFIAGDISSYMENLPRFLTYDVYAVALYIFIITLGAKTAVKMLLPLEKHRLEIASDANIGELDLWALTLFFPKEAFTYAKNRASYSKALNNYWALGLIILVFGIALLAYGLIRGTPVSLLGAWEIMIATYSVATVISAYVLSAIIFVLSRILGGKGRFVVQTYLLSLFVFFAIFATIVIGYSMFYGSYSFTPLLLIIGYNIYMTSLALKETHGYSTLKSILSQPVIYYCIIVIIAAIIHDTNFRG
jgi:hypothetical protein